MSKPIRILLVEDSLDDAELTIRKLRQSDYTPEYTRVETSEDMSAELKNGSWDIILADYSLPHFSAIKALELLKASGLDLPFIIVSGTIGEDIAVEAMRKGAHDYIMKDNLARLIPAIEREIHDADARKERRKTEEQLHKLHSAVEQSPSLVMITDKEGKIEYVNPRYNEITGYSSDEVLGSNASIFKPYEETNYHFAEMWETIKSGKKWSGEFLSRKKNGELFWEEGSIAPVNNKAGKLTNYIKVSEDITERKISLEEKDKLKTQLFQAQKLEAMGALAGGVAHDFNNNLTSIIMCADLAMRMTEPTELIYKNLKMINKSAQQSSNLTRQLLMFSRKQKTIHSAVDINHLLSNIINMLQRLIGEDVRINLEEKQDLLPVLADKGNIEQIIMNLSVNARDAMPEGGTLTIKTENITLNDETNRTNPEAHAGKFIRMSFIDTGTGMSKEVMEHILEPFFTTKDVGMGTGLGLSVVYAIVKDHNGWIDINSEPGSGTTFEVYIPVTEKDIKPESDTGLSIEELKGNNEKILLVEDDPSILESTSTALRYNGYFVLEATNASEAKKIFEEEDGNIDLILSDIVLPGQSGLQFVEELISKNTDLPILLVSGYLDKKSQWPTIKRKGYAFLNKPYTLQQLLLEVKKILEKTI